MTKLGQFLREILTPLLLAAVVGVLVHDHYFAPRQPVAPAAVDGKALGRSFAATVAPDLAAGWSAAADAIEKGKAMADAQAALQSTWQAARIKSFSAQVAPGFASVLPEGTEPTDPGKRAEVVRLWRDFAAGLKGGK